MSNTKFVVTLLIVCVGLAKNADGKTFTCDFDICDTANGQFCNEKDRRCNYCSIRECREEVKDCKEYCDKEFPSTQPPTHTASETNAETQIHHISDIGFGSFSPGLQVIFVVTVVVICIILRLLVYIILYMHRKDQREKKKTNIKVENKIQAANSSDSGVFIENEVQNPMIPLLELNGPKYPVQAEANKEPFTDLPFDPATSRMIAGTHSTGGSLAHQINTISHVSNHRNTRRARSSTDHTPSDTSLNEIYLEGQETNVKSTFL